MTFFLATAFALLGAVVASFMGVIAARLYTGQSFLVGHSRCDACNAALSPFALVPVLSYLAARGRAQCCGARISLVSPLTELLLAALFVLAYLALGLTIVLPFMLIALALLLALVLYDFQHQILPSGLLYTFVAVCVIVAYLDSADFQSFLTIVEVALGIGGSLAALHFLSRGRAMGLADAPLAFALSCLVGPVALTGFIFSFWIGAVVGIAVLLRRPRGSRMGVEVPFAPFLACGYLLAYFTQWNLFTYIAALH